MACHPFLRLGMPGCQKSGRLKKKSQKCAKLLLHRDYVSSPWNQIELNNTNMSAELTTEERFSINFRQMESPQKRLKTGKPNIKCQWTEKAWVPFELGMRNGNTLATEHPFGAQKMLGVVGKYRSGRQGSFPFNKNIGGGKNEN